MRTLSVFILLTGCSEYEFKSAESPTAAEVRTCALDQPAAYAPPATQPCADAPDVGQFDPVVEWNWTDNPIHPAYNQIMAAPVVANLTDDDGNGQIDERDVPDIVFTAFGGGGYSSAGAVVAISGADGRTLWSVTSSAGHAPYGASGTAIADLDGDGVPSVLVSAQGGLLALRADGSHEWFAGGPSNAYGHPAVGDIDGDGIGEVVYGRHVYNHDGSLRWAGTAGTGGGKYGSFAVDVDGDGMAEVIAGNTVYEEDGTVKWTAGSDGWPALGDFDLDGFPEIVTVTGGTVVLTSIKGQEIWRFALTDGGGGPPTVADFDGDGKPEIGVASRQWYRVIDDDGSELWANPVQDFSSSVTGSSVFDFEGDGAAEVVYADEETLWIYDGATGAVEMAWESHSSGTLFEYPLVVDVDNDGSTEIIVASNDYSGHNDSRGITVVGDANDSWAPARPVWNQHAYAIHNIRDDGRVGSNKGNWRRWNSFRAGNSEVPSGLARSDVKLFEPELCHAECTADNVTLWIPLENGGERPIASVDVTLFSMENGREVLLDQMFVDDTPGIEARWVGPFEVPLSAFAGRPLLVRADHEQLVDECEEGNNTWVIANPCDLD